ncbi:heavy-metal-associated domain-containing protein [Flavobacterium zepuense]|uniref:Heavy-metal-associated domain-containing protein n=1 Tax=Flavobacterium zepuense TaxID=2593302 RepID=A0A552UVZ1_9FLAO|nr:heavy-metal-associated domain-containing protein [Flavobacterium zepuense]TRW22320.1 heavy-metal-associated domain-containing protein [Flavobacterium zepuense]
MKFAKKLSLIALAAVLFTSCKDTSKDGNLETPKEEIVTDSTQKKETAANLETATFKIEGMTCPMGCAATIQDKLAHMEGVDDAKVDFDSKTATISFDPAKQTAESFVQTVEKIAGGVYKVSDVKSSGDKAYYSGHDKDKKKKKKAEKEAKEAAAKAKKDGKPSCCSADAKTEKKAGCCSADAKKGGNL